jgi:hypothetical protein
MSIMFSWSLPVVTYTPAILITNTRPNKVIHNRWPPSIDADEENFSFKPTGSFVVHDVQAVVFGVLEEFN